MGKAYISVLHLSVYVLSASLSHNRLGAEHVFSLPLSQRLTDEERERVRKLYIDANDKLKICLNAMNHT